MLSPKLNIERIAVGTLLIIVGFVLLTFSVWIILYWFEFLSKIIARDGGSIKYSFFIIQFHHGIIASFIAILGGILLLRKNTYGWIIGFAMSIYYSIFFSHKIFSVQFLELKASVKDDDIISFFIIPILILTTLLLILSVTFLSLKRTRQQFELTKLNYGIAFGLIAVLMIDLLIF
jgi:hypothetical protein